ncbi:cysteine proteinase [Hypoxylon sp. FL0890]|nr:cysteine proteinase [Hypoxylon sp. FL0890]
MEAKAKEQEALVSRTHGQEALDHAIAAAELYMKAAEAASGAEEHSRLTKKCQSLISKAESLKKLRQAGGGVAAVEKRLKLPRQTREIPRSEQAILLRSSKLHGNIYPPWESDPDPKEFSGDPFTDTAEFSLSERQKAVFSGWKRPLEIFGSDDQSNNSLMEAQNDPDLVQDITTDCSLVASLCASMRHLRPGPTCILPALMFPIDPENGQPKVSANGKYVFRMFVNGCFRKVVIDDRLPSSSTDRFFYVVDRQNPKLIWPALMEKAYLKVRGGYNFPGSNSGTDLCALTGWIPQQLFLQSDEVDCDRTWNRVKKAYDYGDVVVTIGTGRLSLDEEETLGLAGEHDYAVLDMSETSGNRRLLVKNPWCDGMVWKGVGSSAATTSQATDDHPVKLKPGSFWISFDDVTQNFESLYLNWNPSLFTERQDHHFVWQLPDPTFTGGGCFVHNPQYSMTAAADGSTWILLSRHFQDGELDIMHNRTTAHHGANSLAEVSSQLGFMSIYILADHDGQRVQLSTRPVYRGEFVDSPQTLAPFEAKRNVKYTIVVATQDMPLPKYTFTLSFFSRTRLTVSSSSPPLKHYTEVKGSWTRRTAGGNSASPFYAQNPQYSLTLPQKSPLSLLLSTARDDLPVHVDLVWAGGRRVNAVGNRDLVVTSGEYQHGCALAEAPSVDAGTYTVVCSTFESGRLANFVLRVGSDVLCTITPVPGDAAGRLRTRLPDIPSSDGESGSEVYMKKRALLLAYRLTSACVVVTRSNNTQYPSLTNNIGGSNTPRSHPTVRMTVETGNEYDKVVIASTDDTSISGSGEFKEVGVNGVRTGEFDVGPEQPYGLWLVIELLGFTQGAGDGLQVEILSEGPVRFMAWMNGDD